MLDFVLNITVGQFLQSAIYAIPAVFFWYILFRFKNKGSLNLEIVRDTFLIGLCSVIPILFYQHAYTYWFPTISAEYLGGILKNSDIITSMGQVITAFFALGVFFVIIVASFTIFYSLFSKDSFKNTFKAIVAEPLNFSATGIIFLLILVIDIILRIFTPLKIPTEIIGTTFILATLEEYSKHLIVRLFDDHKIKNIANAIELSVVVGLSFAFFENTLYFISNGGDQGLQGLIFGRSIFSMFGHMIFSAIFGYYYGIAKFAKSVMLVDMVEKHVPKLPAWFHKIFHFNNATTFETEKIFEGLIFASLFHMIFNLLMQFNLIVFVVPLLFVGGYVMKYIMESDIAQRDFALVGTKTMPEADFEKLVWRVSIMRHLNEIKKFHPDKKKKK